MTCGQNLGFKVLTCFFGARGLSFSALVLLRKSLICNDLTTTLLQIEPLWGRYGARAFFLCDPRKILFSKNLAGGVSHHALQNLEPIGLIHKILRNKHLAEW